MVEFLMTDKWINGILEAGLFQYSIKVSSSTLLFQTSQRELLRRGFRGQTAAGESALDGMLELWSVGMRKLLQIPGSWLL